MALMDKLESTAAALQLAAKENDKAAADAHALRSAALDVQAAQQRSQLEAARAAAAEAEAQRLRESLMAAESAAAAAREEAAATREAMRREAQAAALRAALMDSSLTEVRGGGQGVTRDHGHVDIHDGAAGLQHVVSH